MIEGRDPLMWQQCDAYSLCALVSMIVTRDPEVVILCSSLQLFVLSSLQRARHVTSNHVQYSGLVLLSIYMKSLGQEVPRADHLALFKKYFFVQASLVRRLSLMCTYMMIW